MSLFSPTAHKKTASSSSLIHHYWFSTSWRISRVPLGRFGSASPKSLIILIYSLYIHTKFISQTWGVSHLMETSQEWMPPLTLSTCDVEFREEAQQFIDIDANTSLLNRGSIAIWTFRGNTVWLNHFKLWCNAYLPRHSLPSHKCKCLNAGYETHTV